MIVDVDLHVTFCGEAFPQSAATKSPGKAGYPLGPLGRYGAMHGLEPLGHWSVKGLSGRGS